jgi:hypothetical protein
MKNQFQNIVAIGSAIGLALFWGWQPLVSLFTGDFNENLNIQISFETVETCKPAKLLVLHIQPQNKGSIPIEMGGEKSGSMIVTVRQIPDDLPVDKWLNPDTLKIVATTDIIKRHPGGYYLDRNIAYDEAETIAVRPGNYWAGVVVTYPDGDYIDQSIVARVSEESCSSPPKRKVT